jgi:heat shock protein HslJ
MKTLGGILSLCAVAVIGVTGCSSDSQSTPELAGRTFTSQEIVVDNVPSPAADNGTIALTFTDDGISVNAGCNTLFANATWADGVISIESDTMASTMMACPEALMSQDQLLSTFFTSDPQWSLEGNQLTVSTPTATLVLIEQ